MKVSAVSAAAASWLTLALWGVVQIAHAEPRVVCSPASFVVPAAQSTGVTVRAWVGGTPGSGLTYLWKADVGTISGAGREITWDLSEIKDGEHKIDLKVLDGHSTLGTCSATIRLLSAMRAPQETGRDFLLRGRQEVPGYGLYSYLLLGAEPTDATRARYLKAIKAYLALRSVSELQAAGLKPPSLNITYLPLVTAPDAEDAEHASDAKHPSDDGKSEEGWLLKHYDWTRARLLLDGLKIDHGPGVYLVSSLTPLQQPGATGHLMQNLSAVPTDPDDLMTWWINEFENQASQQRLWKPRTVQTVMLNVRTTISTLAMGLPDVQKALGDWIRWAE